MKYCTALVVCLLLCVTAHAQETRWLKHQISTLCNVSMEGRGYVHNGREKAANYLVRKFKELGVQPMTADSSYKQVYSFPVNTFPGVVNLTVGKKELQPSADFLIDAASSGYPAANELKVVTIDFGKSKTLSKVDSLPDVWKLVAKQNVAYYLKQPELLLKKLNMREGELLAALPKGMYLYPQHSKLMWTVATDTMAATVFHVADTSLPKKVKKITFEVGQKFEPQAKSTNLIGYVKGTAVPDSFIVFSAHYDHLGKMGDALFPGASDNASGTAAMLWLANYYAAHPQRYSVAFIAFSGEEAGLLGSAYYVKHPVFPLERIRFLTNIDIMGDATDGITVVNATEYTKEFSLLERLNDKGSYLPAIKSRGKAAISDHYLFSENGVPCFFMYSDGGKGYYHDVFDKANELSLKNVDGVLKLLTDFTGALQ